MNDQRNILLKKIEALGWVYSRMSLEEFAAMSAPNPSKNDKINAAKFYAVHKEVCSFLKQNSPSQEE